MTPIQNKKLKEQNQETRELISARRASHKQPRPKSPMVPITWHASKYKVHKLHHSYIPLVLATGTRSQKICYVISCIAHRESLNEN